MIVRPAAEQDTPGFITLARQVEHWFGPMAGEPGFRAGLGFTPGEPAPPGPEGGSRQVYRKTVN